MEFTDSPSGVLTTGENPQTAFETAPRDESGPLALYDGKTGAIARITLVNALLAVLTLGIHSFWGKTRLRQHIWSRISVKGERLEYTGTAGEAALRFAVGASVFVILFALVWEAMDGIYHRPVQFTALKLALVIGIPFLIFFAQFRARRYRLSQTQWRGLRFSQRGNVWIYTLQATALLLVVVLTGGLAYPYMQSRLQHYRINNTWLGDRQFKFNGLAGDLFRQWVPALLLAVPTLGLSVLWYKVAEFRYVAAHTRLGSLGFSSTLPSKGTVLSAVKFIAYAAALSLLSALIVLGSAGVILALANIGGEIPQAPHSIKVQLQIFLGVALFCFFLAAFLKSVYVMVLLHPMIDAITKTLTAKGTIDLDSIKPGETVQISQADSFPDALKAGTT